MTTIATSCALVHQIGANPPATLREEISDASKEGVEHRDRGIGIGPEILEQQASAEQLRRAAKSSEASPRPPQRAAAIGAQGIRWTILFTLAQSDISRRRSVGDQ